MVHPNPSASPKAMAQTKSGWSALWEPTGVLPFIKNHPLAIVLGWTVLHTGLNWSGHFPRNRIGVGLWAGWRDSAFRGGLTGNFSSLEHSLYHKPLCFVHFMAKQLQGFALNNDFHLCPLTMLKMTHSKVIIMPLCKMSAEMDRDIKQLAQGCEVNEKFLRKPNVLIFDLQPYQ